MWDYIEVCFATIIFILVLIFLLLPPGNNLIRTQCSNRNITNLSIITIASLYLFFTLSVFIRYGQN